VDTDLVLDDMRIKTHYLQWRSVLLQLPHFKDFGNDGRAYGLFGYEGWCNATRDDITCSIPYLQPE